MAKIPNRPEYQSDLFKKGLEVRRDVLGADYVDASLTRADDFNAAFQQITTEVAWGMIWTRPGLPRKTRSMINLTMLAALNRGAEFRLQQPEQRAECALDSAVRRSRHHDEVSVGLRRDFPHQVVALMLAGSPRHRG